MAKGAVGGVVNACYSRFHFFGSAGSNPAQPLAFAFAAVALSVYELVSKTSGHYIWLAGSTPVNGALTFIPHSLMAITCDSHSQDQGSIPCEEEYS